MAGAVSRRVVLHLAAQGGLACVAMPRAQAQPVPQPIVQPSDPGPEAFMARAAALRDRAVAAGDQGYGAVVVKDGVIVGEGPSRVVTAGDPTAHAEMEAIRDAARRLGTRDLAGSVIYASSRPCPMCGTAAHWAGIARVFHGPGMVDAGRPAYPNC